MIFCFFVISWHLRPDVFRESWQHLGHQQRTQQSNPIDRFREQDDLPVEQCGETEEKKIEKTNSKRKLEKRQGFLRKISSIERRFNKKSNKFNGTHRMHGQTDSSSREWMTNRQRASPVVPFVQIWLAHFTVQTDVILAEPI